MRISAPDPQDMDYHRHVVLSLHSARRCSNKVQGVLAVDAGWRSVWRSS